MFKIKEKNASDGFKSCQKYFGINSLTFVFGTIKKITIKKGKRNMKQINNRDVNKLFILDIGLRPVYHISIIKKILIQSSQAFILFFFLFSMYALKLLAKFKYSFLKNFSFIDKLLSSCPSKNDVNMGSMLTREIYDSLAMPRYEFSLDWA
ncbi:hypothetical protein BpHYR1_008049 [Brachionus plicatilis]|uniref:Uncharacterized protein n=1 Tax=Brachionus plicatilis TaxID=10195 RepID=A0A3M7T302_BRAPC|nr:hypothetical protein BpHYR1_008049 [Brachionus plicatilis]